MEVVFHSLTACGLSEVQLAVIVLLGSINRDCFQGLAVSVRKSMFYGDTARGPDCKSEAYAQTIHMAENVSCAGAFSIN